MRSHERAASRRPYGSTAAYETCRFVRNAESARLARITVGAPHLLMIGPRCRGELHVGRSEDELSMVQLALERQLQRRGWSYEGCERH